MWMFFGSRFFVLWCETLVIWCMMMFLVTSRAVPVDVKEWFNFLPFFFVFVWKCRSKSVLIGSRRIKTQNVLGPSTCHTLVILSLGYLNPLPSHVPGTSFFPCLPTPWLSPGSLLTVTLTQIWTQMIVIWIVFFIFFYFFCFVLFFYSRITEDARCEKKGRQLSRQFTCYVIFLAEFLENDGACVRQQNSDHVFWENVSPNCSCLRNRTSP